MIHLFCFNLIGSNQYYIELPPGVFYWSVQSVDGNYSSSKFATSQKIVLKYPWQFLNQGGLVDTRIQPLERPSFAWADVNNRGVFDFIYLGKVVHPDKTIIQNNYANIDAITVWGGEDNDPPTYGKVYVAIKPTTGEVLTPTEKKNLINSVINPKKILTISTEIVDPEYLYIIIDSTVKYEANKTILSSDDLIDLVTSTIQSYNTDDINQFGKYFRYSKLSRLIDMSEASILNNDTSTLMRKELNVQLNVPTKYEINFSNAIDATTNGRPSTHPFGVGNKIYSNVFSYAGYDDCKIEENDGIIRIYRTEKNENIGVLLNAGTVNYTTGKVILNSFTPTAFADGGNTLKLTASPAEKDILPLRKSTNSCAHAVLLVVTTLNFSEFFFINEKNNLNAFFKRANRTIFKCL